MFNLAHGFARTGELLAVMGSSGAGKTTLLNALAYRDARKQIVSDGATRVLNGRHVNAVDMKRFCAYVQQEDVFLASLTPKEHLLFHVNIFKTLDMIYISN